MSSVPMSYLQIDQSVRARTRARRPPLCRCGGADSSGMKVALCLRPSKTFAHVSNRRLVSAFGSWLSGKRRGARVAVGCGSGHESRRHGPAVEDPRCSQLRLLQRFVVDEVRGLGGDRIVAFYLLGFFYFLA